MSWTKTKRRRADPAANPWSSEESETLADAVSRAPSVHDSPPCSLRMRDRSVALHERRDEASSRDGPGGRDRRISCGAALANLVLAVRDTGWSARVQWAGTGDLPDLVATVLAEDHEKPSATEGQRYRAIIRRSSHRGIFEDEPIPHATREALWAAANTSGVYARWVTGEPDALVLARQLRYGAEVFHADRRYHRELAAWTLGEADERYPDEAPSGSATSAGRLPDEETLASCITRESVLVLAASSDSELAHYLVGAAMELAWLSATSLGLAASALVQPFHLAEIRTDLARCLGLPGVPQVVLRLGYPIAPVQRGAHGASSELAPDADSDQ